MKVSIQDVADANLLEAIREHARWQNPCECVEDDGVMMVAGPNAFPIAFRNCVVRVDGGVAAAQVVERAREFFSMQASAYGEPLYRRLGYTTYDRLLRFRYPETGNARVSAD